MVEVEIRILTEDHLGMGRGPVEFLVGLVRVDARARDRHQECLREPRDAKGGPEMDRGAVGRPDHDRGIRSPWILTGHPGRDLVAPHVWEAPGRDGLGPSAPDVDLLLERLGESD
ncbi:MAG TPA: hypothetical protein VII47_11425 [Actinomycetota bacterium]